MAQNPPPPGRLYYGGVPAGYMITTNVNLPYPLPPQLPVLLQPTPSNLYPVSVQMATQPATSKPILGAHTVYSAPAPPARPANTPAGYNFVFHPQPQPAQAVTPRAAPGTATQYVPGAYPDAEAVALAQAQAASLAAHAAEVAKNHAAGVAIAKAEAANVQYYFGNSTVSPQPVTVPQPSSYGFFVRQVRTPEEYAYGIIAPQQVMRPVSPTDYGSGDPLGRRFHYTRRP